jgi:hypothetical protein
MKIARKGRCFHIGVPSYSGFMATLTSAPHHLTAMILDIKSQPLRAAAD